MNFDISISGLHRRLGVVAHGRVALAAPTLSALAFASRARINQATHQKQVRTYEVEA